MKFVNIALLFLLTIMLWMHWFGDGGSNDFKEKQILYELQLDKNKELQARNEKLMAEVEDLKHGLEAMEERARSELGLIKPGETFIQVIDNNESQ
jgi:cell division protein FtsB